MTCDSCGHDLPPDARFCPGCGTAVADMRDDGVAAEGDDEQDAPTPEALPDEGGGKARRTPATIAGNVLAVAAGGTLGVLVGLAIRQAM